MKPFEPVKPGTTLAGFNVLAEIGRGAASFIYLVQDAKTKQIWALKHVARHDPKDQRFLDQAIKEYEVAQKVKHPIIRHIERVIKNRVRLVTVTDLFLLMEYVDGLSVERRPPTSMSKALDIFIQTAQGMSHMHQKGFVHADMKPNNIVVDPSGRVKIIDLGQACPVGTVKERIQGTPEYIAPEQVHRREITPKTDVYNLGATMYWTLTGRHIPTAMPKDSQSLLDQLDDRFIEKPKPVCDFNSGVPQELNDLILECVQVDPEKRPASMAEIIDRLEKVKASMDSGTESAAEVESPAASSSRAASGDA